MKAQRLTWYEDLEVDATGECPKIRHLILEPTWNDVVQAVHRLDGKRYTFVTLSTQKNCSPPERFTMLNIVGDGSLYAASLEFYSEQGKYIGESIRYIVPELYEKPVSSGYHCFGRGSTNREIQNEYLTDDLHLIQRLAMHFLDAGKWEPGVSYAVENANEPTDYGYGHEW